MLKLNILTAALLLVSIVYGQQRYFTKNGHINFYSHAPLEDIRANNEQVAAFLEVPSGKLTFAALMKSFDFEKALMEEHFNENYMESDQFPKTVFKGLILDFADVDLKTEGKKKVEVKGRLTLHGVTQDMSTSAVLDVRGDEIIGTCTFIAKPDDFNIKIPKAVKDNIAKEIEVNVKVLLKPYNK